MKRISSVFAVIFFALPVFCLGANFAMCEEQKPPREPVKVGVFNFEGYHMRDDDGNLSGYGIDLYNLLSQYSDLDFIFTGFDKSWQEMQEMLKNGEIDLLSTARRTPTREALFAFSLPVGMNQTTLYKKVTNNKIRAGDYPTYNGMKIGVLRGSSQNSYLDAFSKDKKFNYTTVEFDLPHELSEALQKGEVDAILSSNLRKPENETLLDVLQSDNFYMIARKEDQALIDEINYAIEQMNLNEGDWVSRLYYHHYGARNSLLPEFSGREESFIKAARNGDKNVVAYARKDNPPYSYMEKGQLTGILPDYFSLLMDIIGIPYKVEPLEEEPRETDAKIEKVLLDKLESEQSGENLPADGFSTSPYFETALARLTRKEFKDAPKTVALPESMPFHLPPRALENLNIVYYPGPQEAIEAVEAGKADVAYVLPYTAQIYFNAKPDSDLFSTVLNGGSASFRIFMPAGSDHELITLLKKAMKNVAPVTLNQLGAKYIVPKPGEMGLYNYLYANPKIMAGVVITFAFATSLIIIMWLKSIWNRRLLATTESASRELQEQFAIVEALSRDYNTVLALDPERKQVSMIKGAPISAVPTHAEILAGAPGANYASIIGNYVEKFVHPEDKEYARAALSLEKVMNTLAAREEYSGTFRVKAHDKTHYYQFTFVRPSSPEDGEENLVLAGIKNIDDVMQREREQKKILTEALAQSRYASAAKTTFLNNMSHDIRTPMNAIIGFTHLASKNLGNADLVRRYLGKIMTSGNHLLNLINDVLDMSRIESGKVKLKEAEVNLGNVLHEMSTITQADAEAKNLNFKIDAVDITNEDFVCDRLRLNQILLNILSNAIKYTPAGGSIQLRVTQLSSPKNGRALYEFRVSDTGIGMSEEFVKHVFEPFEREQTATVSGIQGTGLGLTITKTLVELMGGTIKVESKTGVGSKFITCFNFPVAEDADKNWHRDHFRGQKALLVVNDATSAKKLDALLSDLGLDISIATTDREALAQATNAEERDNAYDLLFIECEGSNDECVALAEKLRQQLSGEPPIFLFPSGNWAQAQEKFGAITNLSLRSRPLLPSDIKNMLLPLVPGGQAKSGRADATPTFSGHRLLLAEDNEMNQEIAQMILEEVGFEVDIVENGQLAVEKMKEMEAGHYDLVLMDVQMPVMDGYTATRQIRALKDKNKAGIPIIAMTANAFDEDREEAIASGMNGYVAKPIDVANLMGTLDQTINGVSGNNPSLQEGAL